MESSLQYGNDQYGTGDYAQLDRWSGHGGIYKTTPNDSSSLIYTSDYGSYSSQESNHSGTTYSNLADCEEALRSPSSTAYDLPSPQLFGSMEKRRDKPLPPPRMTSKVQIANKARFLETVKEKKISFDDSSLTNNLDGKKKADDSVPSFATLPRKKKLSSNATTGTPQAAPQVTWMKEVAQKGESINRARSASAIANKKPQGILKNKMEDQRKKGDTTGYIKRNTVQRILEQQKSAQSKQSPSPRSAQFYKSAPSLTPTTSPEGINQQHKAWEHNFNGNNSTQSSTAQVIGVFEPSKDGTLHIHTKQNSTETEFEFPPPPSDHDIKQLMKPGTTSAPSDTPNNDFTPLKLACVRGDKPPASTDRNVKKTEHTSKPPVPQRAKRSIDNNTMPSAYQQHKASAHYGMQTHVNKQTIPVREQKVPPTRVQVHKLKEAPSDINIAVHPSTHIDSTSQNTDDLVLPPPPEFQEGDISTSLVSQQPSYGDYELLSPDSSYECTNHPTVVRHSSPKPYVTARSSYHHRTVVDQLGTQLQSNMKVNQQNDLKPTIRERGLDYPYRYSNGLSNNNMYSHNRGGKEASYISHHYQHSTEL